MGKAADLVRQYRQRHRMQLTRVAQRLNLSYPYVHKMETGTRAFPMTHAVDWADIVGVPLRDMENALQEDSWDQRQKEIDKSRLDHDTRKERIKRRFE